MRILILSNYYPPHYIGGYELACYDTVKYLESVGHEVFVVTGNHAEESEDFSKVYRKLKYIDYKNSSYKNKHEVESYNYDVTSNAIDVINPDIVYIWSLRLVSLSPLWAIEKHNKKKIFEIGDFWMKGFLSNSFSSKLKRKTKELLPGFKAKKVEISPVITVSKWMIPHMKDLYGSKEVYCVPNGTTITREKYDKPQNTMNYMFCGRLDYSKGLDIAIKALSSLKDREIENFRLDIYGDGDKNYILKCKKIIKILKLEDNIFFHGKKSDLKDAYKKAHVLLMPTRMKEPFGLVLIEAMNYGVVPIATNDYGPLEIISNEEDGLHFDITDANDLEKKILLINNNWSLLKRYRENAYKKVAKKYDINIVKNTVEKILLEVVGK